MAHTEIRNMTALQKHVSFFDRNKDGIITPSETFEGDLFLQQILHDLVLLR